MPYVKEINLWGLRKGSCVHYLDLSDRNKRGIYHVNNSTISSLITFTRHTAFIYSDQGRRDIGKIYKFTFVEHIGRKTFSVKVSLIQK